MLYDGIRGHANAAEQKLRPDLVEKLRAMFSKLSPFWNEFKRFSEMPSHTGNLILSGGDHHEVAEIISTESTTEEDSA